MVEFFALHCVPDDQDCKCRTVEPGKEPMWLLEYGGYFCNCNGCMSGKKPMLHLDYGQEC